MKMIYHKFLNKMKINYDCLDKIK